PRGVPCLQGGRPSLERARRYPRHTLTVALCPAPAFTLSSQRAGTASVGTVMRSVQVGSIRPTYTGSPTGANRRTPINRRNGLELVSNQAPGSSTASAAETSD